MNSTKKMEGDVVPPPPVQALIRLGAMLRVRVHAIAEGERT